MAFPLTHLCVAYKVLETLPSPAPELFMLGSIAPDAVHFRAEFLNATQSNIGPAKKITHLCPVSEERWGRVTDVDGWKNCVRSFLRTNPGNPLAAGYAVHVLTDIYNHISIWENFVTNHPEEAAKGYASEYYKDLRTIDLRIYNEFYKGSEIERLLRNSAPQDMPGLVTAEELLAGRDSLLSAFYANADGTVDTSSCFFVTYQQTLEFINDAAAFCIKIIGDVYEQAIDDVRSGCTA
ncbi:MAG: hypothetical protein FWC32_12305 [Firmicutes bacterium]|nr:hypothetical protein [Bacillota bacterium]